MARPKSYTDEDIIDIATQLSSKGRKPTGWYVKEILDRGKIASIQADLERLTSSQCFVSFHQHGGVLKI